MMLRTLWSFEIANTISCVTLILIVKASTSKKLIIQQNRYQSIATPYMPPKITNYIVTKMLQPNMTKD